MKPQLANDRATSGEHVIAVHTKCVFGYRRIGFAEYEDFLQDVHTELLRELGSDYLEKIGGREGVATDDLDRTLRRCVDRVAKRFQRRKKHVSLDQLITEHDLAPIDPASINPNSTVESLALATICREQMSVEERQVAELLLVDLSNRERWERLGIGHSKFFTLKKTVIEKMALLFQSHS